MENNVIVLKKKGILNISKDKNICNTKFLTVGINWVGDADLDLSCFAFKDNKLEPSGVCCYGQPEIFGVMSTGDVRTSTQMSEMFKEEIIVEMDKVKNKYNRLLFLITIHQSTIKFGNITLTAGLAKNSYSEKELVTTINVSDDYPSSKSMLLLEIVKDNTTSDYIFRVLEEAQNKSLGDYLRENDIPFEE